MRRMLFSAALLGVAIVGLNVPAAIGETSGSFAVQAPPDTILYSDCYDYDYSYAVSAPSDDWNVEISLTDPVGADESSDYLYDGGDLRTGTGSFYLCGNSDDFGTYTMTSVLTYYDDDFNATVEPPAVTSFTLAKPATKTTLSVSTERPAFDKRVTFKAKSVEQGRMGYASADYAHTRLEFFAKGAWHKLKAGTASAHGTSKFRFRWDIRRGVKVRAVTVATDTARESFSRPVRVKAR